MESVVTTVDAVVSIMHQGFILDFFLEINCLHGTGRCGTRNRNPWISGNWNPETRNLKPESRIQLL